jgi:hypothetical protein
MNLVQLLMMVRLRLACALAKDFAIDNALTEAQGRRDRCRQPGEIPVLQALSGCDQAATSGRWNLNCARSPFRSHPYCSAFVALTLAEQWHATTCRV